MQNGSLINTILECAQACEHCATSCLKAEDVAEMSRCIQLDRDCADICFQAARLLKRKSEIALPYLLLCEKICRMCAEECKKHENDHCQTCAKKCLECADACHQHHKPIEQD
ncbi:four-helix bundle copper-binding protein [Cytophagaceae bacterium ABcell3]|nr:four-helix bundle copper-binding protein [Cytophagaceae bacterium ABcell3]